MFGEEAAILCQNCNKEYALGKMLPIMTSQALHIYSKRRTIWRLTDGPTARTSFVDSHSLRASLAVIGRLESSQYVPTLLRPALDWCLSLSPNTVLLHSSSACSEVQSQCSLECLHRSVSATVLPVLWGTLLEPHFHAMVCIVCHWRRARGGQKGTEGDRVGRD